MTVVLNRHPTPVPDVCDVCRYALAQGADAENEHALTRLATLILSEALAALGGGPASLPGLVVFSFPPVDGGPVHRFEPRHYFWAIFHEPELQLTRRQEAAA